MAPTVAALLGVRLIGLTLCVVGLQLGMANLIEGGRGFNPAHWRHFFLQLLLRPTLWLLFGLLLLAAAPLIAGFLV
ncbi:MAG: hypothetical protein ACFE0O_03625 [Opitutales bacterium]